MDKKSLAKKIDHTVLKADATVEDVKKLCAEARQYGFASVCVNPLHVKTAFTELGGSGVDVCSVVGFPLGATTPEVKAAEAEHAVNQGAGEVDMVINIGALKAGDLVTVEEDIRAVVEASEEACVKVIIETCYLTDEQKVTACKLCVKAGAGFVKTSTGFGPAGATVQDVTLMKETVGSACKVKAAGGIRDLETALAMIEAGADRLGMSAGIKVMEQLESGSKS